MFPEFVDVARLPPGGLSQVAAIYESFDAHLARLEVNAVRVHESAVGGAFRHVALRLSSGRLAELNQSEKYPDYFYISLEDLDELYTSRSDFDEVCALLDVDTSKVVIFTGQVMWKP